VGLHVFYLPLKPVLIVPEAIQCLEDTLKLKVWSLKIRIQALILMLAPNRDWF